MFKHVMSEARRADIGFAARSASPGGHCEAPSGEAIRRAGCAHVDCLAVLAMKGEAAACNPGRGLALYSARQRALQI